MKKVIEIISQIPKHTAYSFSMSMVVFIVISLIVGMESISTNSLIQLLIICIVTAILQIIAFSNICIKNLAYTKRLAVFMFPFLVILTAIAVKFEWFPIESIGSWGLFIGIFLTYFIVSTVLFEIYFKITGDKYTGILNEYKNKKK